MRTRKLPVVPLIVCCLCMVQLFNCQEERQHGTNELVQSFTKYRGQSSGDKYQTDSIENNQNDHSEDNDPSNFLRNDDNSYSLYRNNRAIDIPGSSERSSGKNSQQSTPSNLPKNNLKPSETTKEIYKKHQDEKKNDGLCRSIDIRNTVNTFDQLKDCRVIEGFLHIVLIENNSTRDFEKLTFPKLREITGYFLLYRVNNIKSLNNMFPNLEVIRGKNLLADFSFMVYEMQHLQEIGLSKLTNISRGGVRIENNPSLCYVSTLNWSSIANAGENVIKDNCNEIACPVCSTECHGHCWNAQHCQKLKRSNCHEQCLDDCSGPTELDCYVCKNYRHQGKCVETCPSHLFSFLSRRCITKEECLQENDRENHIFENDGTWRPFMGECSTQCPIDYEDLIEKNTTTCQKCIGRCHKIGPGSLIRHISDAQRYRGVTIVRGALEFQIRNAHPNIISELTEAFGSIEEITGYLKVTHSFSITTLSFFKNLRVIRGESLDINNASLVVLDNPNLSNLFLDNNKMEIENGRLFFHYNPKLCMSKIRQLAEMVKIEKISNLEVQPDSNGDKVACDIYNININVVIKGSTHAVLKWDVYKPDAGQSLLGYLLNYIETESEDVNYDGNACGNNTWQIVDVGVPRFGQIGTKVSQILTNLKPYTKYAVYVKTFATRNRTTTNSQTGQSEIIFFRTHSDVPSGPTNLESLSLTDSEINVTWSLPEYPNGPIDYYIVAGIVRPEDENLLFARNYCTYGLITETEIEEVTEIAVETTTIVEESCCSKDVTPKTIRRQKPGIYCFTNMTITDLSSERKNYCYNNKDKKHLYGIDDYLSYLNVPRNPKINANRTEIFVDRKPRIQDGRYHSFLYNVSTNSTYYHLKKLRHYSLYTISVAACGPKLDNGTEICSVLEFTNSRTKKVPNADNVRNVNVQVSNDTLVIVSWEPPRDPNGLTVSYTIEYTNIMVKDAKKSTDCVPSTLYLYKQRAVHYIKNLSPGRYSVRVRSVSLAGEGTFSEAVECSIGIKRDNTVVLVILLTFTFILTAIVIAYLVFRNYQKKKQQERLIASVNPDYIETKYVKDSWEVPRENIELLEEFGLGNFGMVYRGIIEGTTQVAVKTILDTSGEREKNEFLNEASVMKNFSTYHIVRLLGVVSEGSPPYVIMELMENGDLKTYLRRTRDSNRVPDLSRIIRIACEIADGMAYLESKKFVHRDLAARNCMVSKDLVCKIGDFGMARDIYETDYYKIGKKALLPIRWMAPENLSDGVFTSDSDVWSYGVVLYEILTLAEMPYQGYSNDEVLNYVLRKGTVTIPRNCPEMIVKIMEKCFKWRPSDRPTFMELVAELEPFISQDFCEKSFYHSEEGVEIRNLGLKKVYHHAAPIRFHWGNETARWVREFEDNVTLLDQTKAGTSRGRIFKNGFQHFGNIATMEDVPLNR